VVGSSPVSNLHWAPACPDWIATRIACTLQCDPRAHSPATPNMCRRVPEPTREKQHARQILEVTPEFIDPFRWCGDRCHLRRVAAVVVRNGCVNPGGTGHGVFPTFRARPAIRLWPQGPLPPSFGRPTCVERLRRAPHRQTPREHVRPRRRSLHAPRLQSGHFCSHDPISPRQGDSAICEGVSAGPCG